VDPVCDPFPDALREIGELNSKAKRDENRQKGQNSCYRLRHAVTPDARQLPGLPLPMHPQAQQPDSHQGA
jgi:hypothetical protein